MNLDHLEAIRLLELACVRAELAKAVPAGCSILEIGAGTGWQARELSKLGYSIEAIDIGDSNYAADRVWPIRNYDGKTIPFPTATFDVVFSSNVLEHIPDVEEFQSEIARVLKPNGIALHLVPSASWRIWTNVTYYGFVVRKIGRLVASKLFKAGPSARSTTPTPTGPPPAKRKLYAALIPSRHGERGNALTELHDFGRRRWVGLFRAAQWTVTRAYGGGVFHTGYSLLGAAVPLERRAQISRYIGSSCHVFVLSKQTPLAKNSPQRPTTP